jgi:universal stress protein A
MSEYTNILVAIDFSSSADQVLAKAQQVAQRNKAKLNLIHVVEYAPPIDSAFDPMLAGNTMIDEDVLLDNARQSLEKLSKRNKLTDTDLAVQLGRPKHEITRYVEDHQCDLVIIGSHGRHGISMLLGSTANAIVHAMPCDVLTVKIEE